MVITYGCLLAPENTEMAQRELKRLLGRPHVQWLAAPGMLLALVDRVHALWLALIAGAILLGVGLLEREMPPESRRFKILDGFGVFTLGCLAMILVRLLTEFALSAMKMSSQRGNALWLAAVILTSGWIVWSIKRLWLFAFGVTEIAWGVIVGLNSQALLKDPSGGVQLVSVVTGVFLVTRGLSDCAEANLGSASSPAPSFSSSDSLKESAAK